MSVNNPLWNKLFRKYNAVFGEAFDRILNDAEAFAGLNVNNHEEALRHAVCNSIQKWHEQPLDDEPGSPTGDDVIAKIDSLELAIDLLRFAADACDDDIPDIIKIRLSTFGQPLIDRLAAAVLAAEFKRADPASDEDATGMLITASYLKLLGDWQIDACAGAIVEKFSVSSEPDDLIADAVRYYLLAVGSPAVSPLLDHLGKTLDQQQDLDTAGEYMLITLTDLSKEEPNDAAFACLRSAFRNMSHKAIGAICIGDYGDGRGIPVLKGWLDRNPSFQDNQTISEILSSIKRLGGDISDVQHRLKLDRR